MLTVLETTTNLEEFDPHTGALLDNSSTLGHKQVTTCLRFLTYQFTTVSGTVQFLFGWGGTFIGSGWQGSELTGLGVMGGWFWFPIWDIKIWNHVCIMLNSVTEDMTVVLNGEKVLNRNMKWDLSLMNTNLSIMGYPTMSSYSYSLFGKITDVNMWSHSLAVEEAVSWTLCRMKEGGNLVDWRTATWEARRLQEVQVEREVVCRKRQDRLLVLDTQRDFDGTLRLARILGGNMATADSQESAENISKALEPVKHICQNVFTGFTDRRVEGEWVNVYTQEQLTWKNWAVGEPASSGNEDCVGMTLLTYEQYDISCFNKYCSIIQLKETPKFQMTGVCKGSKVDNFYTILLPSDNKTLLAMELIGFKHTKMTWSVKQKRWNIVNLFDGDILAHTNSTKDIPFGSHSWFFTNNSCYDQGKTRRLLNLQQKVKQPGYFCCDDGICINSELRCDGNNHCLDSSDEKACQSVQIPKTYNKDIPPSEKEISGVDIRFRPLEIATSLANLNILNINEQASIISLHFGVVLEWSDYRLKYNFLKTDGRKNAIENEKNMIWIPKLTVLRKSDQTKSVEVGRQITIKKHGFASMEGTIEGLYANESYSGSENPISLEIGYQGEFYCDFAEIEKYPFDTEECSVKYYLSGTMNNLIKLIPTLPIASHRPSSVGQYSVKGWKIESGILEEGTMGVKVTIKLGRSIGSIFTVTYLPTILMNLVNQATNYSKNNYDLLITVNITCMMVLASVYISVSGSLPLTAGMKFIEIWLLFNLAYPVMVIIVNILLRVREPASSLLYEVEINLLFQYAKDKQAVVDRRRIRHKRKQDNQTLFTKPEVKVIPSDILEKKKPKKIDTSNSWGNTVNVVCVIAWYVNPAIYILFSVVYFIVGMILC